MKRTLMLVVAALMMWMQGMANETQTLQTIRGKVMDAVTGYPLIGAHIVLIGSDPLKGTTADVHGHFVLADVPQGRQSLEISYVGYEKRVIQNLLVTSGRETSVEVLMEESRTTLEKFAVTSSVNKEQALNEMAYVSARTFSVEETERYAGSLGDPARMVANFAGVMTQSDSRNDIIIRGNSPMGVLWRIEGIEIPNPNHFAAQGTTGGPVSMVNNNLLANSDFLTGAFPAEFGNATAGVFDLNLRSGNARKPEFTGQIGFNGFELGAEGPAFKMKNGQRASYLANYRYSTLDLMHKIGFGSGTGVAIPEYQDLTFLADLPGTRAGRFKVFGLWGKSAIRMGRDLADTNETQYNARGTATDFSSSLAVAGISHTLFFSPNTRLKTTLAIQQSNTETAFDSVLTQVFKPVYRGNQTESRFSFSTQLRHKVNSNANFIVGLMADRFYVDFVDSVMTDEYQKFITITDADGMLELIRGYGQWQHRFGKGFTGNAGVHVQYVLLNDEVSVEPRLGMTWQVTPRQSLSAGFGMHSQMQPKEIYFVQTYHSDTDTYSLSNEELKMTRSNHFVAGHQYLLNSHFRIRTELYYQQLYNVPVREGSPTLSLVNAGDFFSAPKANNLINEGKGRNLGAELTVERFLNKGWYFLFTASLFDSKYTGHDQVWRNTAFNGNYVFNLLGGYEMKVGTKGTFTVDLKTVWAGGKRYIPIDAVASKEQAKEVRDVDNSYASKYADYFRTDLRLGYRINHKKFSQEWAIDLQNITGYQSIFMEGWDVVKEEVYQVYQQGFMPMFLYRIQF